MIVGIEQLKETTGRVLGVDFGDVRTGLAVSDAARFLASGLGTISPGGMDKTALRKDKAAVDAEIERMQRLVELGGFLPCPDHRLMPGTKFELVQYYAEQIKKIKV